MLKKFAIILSCGFLTFSIQAQDFGGGVILGLSTSQVGGDDLAGFIKQACYWVFLQINLSLNF